MIHYLHQTARLLYLICKLASDGKHRGFVSVFESSFNLSLDSALTSEWRWIQFLTLKVKT